MGFRSMFYKYEMNNEKILNITQNKFPNGKKFQIQNVV